MCTTAATRRNGSRSILTLITTHCTAPRSTLAVKPGGTGPICDRRISGGRDIRRHVKNGIWDAVPGPDDPKINNPGLLPQDARKEQTMNDTKIPVFLLYPDDQISEMMFEKSMKQIQNTRCGYRFMLYSDAARSVPEIEKQSQQFEIDEIHYYYKEDSPSWYSICTMKGETVKSTPVRNWVEKADQFAVMLGAMDQALRTPKSFRGRAYKKVALVDMEEWNAYNQLHGFDESHVYCHVFYLNKQLYKKFILMARRNDCSWRVEVNIPSETEQILPPDFVPAGQTFGSFYPLNTDTSSRVCQGHHDQARWYDKFFRKLKWRTSQN